MKFSKQIILGLIFLSTWIFSFLLHPIFHLSPFPIVSLQIEPIAAEIAPDRPPIGRILSVDHDPILKPGKLVYSGEILQPAVNANIRFFCYATAKVLTITGGTVLNIDQVCTLPPLVSSVCYQPGGGAYPCGGSRGTVTPLKIIRPFNSTVLTSAPQFSWVGDPAVTQYALQIRDLGNLEPKQEVNIPVHLTQNQQITVDYPFEKTLTPGEGYKLTIEATKGDTHFYGKSQFSVLEIEDAQRIQTLAKELKDLGIANEEIALQDLYSLYMNHHLKADTLELLERLADQGSQNPQVYFKLGYLYFEQNLLEMAKAEFEKSISLVSASPTNPEQQEMKGQAIEILKEIEGLY